MKNVERDEGCADVGNLVEMNVMNNLLHKVGLAALIVFGAVIFIGMCQGYSEMKLDDYKAIEQRNAQSRAFLDQSQRAADARMNAANEEANRQMDENARRLTEPSLIPSETEEKTSIPNTRAEPLIDYGSPAEKFQFEAVAYKSVEPVDRIVLITDTAIATIKKSGIHSGMRVPSRLDFVMLASKVIDDADDKPEVRRTYRLKSVKGKYKYSDIAAAVTMNIAVASGLNKTR